jgi:hypothetical protein
MTTPPTNPNPAYGGEALAGYDPAGHQDNIMIQVGTPVQDATTGIWYAPLVSNSLHGSAVDTTNSSTTPLGSGAAFTGTWQNGLFYSALSVQVFADKASAAGGLQIEQSQDGTNADTIDSFNVVASTNFQTTVNLTGKFYRIVYTNTNSAQGTFRLQTVTQTQDVVLPRTLSPFGNLKSENFLTSLIAAGQGFAATTGILATATNANVYIALGLLCSAITKNVYIYRASVMAQNLTGDVRINGMTSFDANVATAVTAVNQNMGSATTALATTKSTANSNTAPTSTTGTIRFQTGGTANGHVELLQQGSGIFIPAASTQGVTVWIKIPTAANAAAINMEWVEF